MSYVEARAIKNFERANELMEKINKIEPELNSLRYAVSQLNDQDRELIELKYEKNYTITDLSFHFELTVDGINYREKQIFKKLNMAVNGYDIIK